MLLRMARVIYDECLCVYVCRWKCDCAGGDNRSVFIKHFFSPKAAAVQDL